MPAVDLLGEFVCFCPFFNLPDPSGLPPFPPFTSTVAKPRWAYNQDSPFQIANNSRFTEDSFSFGIHRWTNIIEEFTQFKENTRNCLERQIFPLMGWWSGKLLNLWRLCLKMLNQYKLDGVAPLMTDPPPTNFTSFAPPPKNKKKRKKKKIVTCDTWHVTPDTWHVTRDTWHLTHDTWHMTGRGRWNFCQNFSSLALTGLMGQWEVILCQPLWSYRQYTV